MSKQLGVEWHMVSIARGHPRSATESYMRTLEQADFDEEEYHAALHLPNVRFVTKIVEQLIPVSHKDSVHRTWIL
ncbi:L-aminoadipate-semialdehyde dehydrogenase-phosphopantetheinyl transferase isoform X2 [Prunus yedoensis var. nudiflora]|uniref:L-aminoadipate-semialdehyde dehydrogenase-phosphopantetheinyl transferase isoform X2 n=1 Tax=Prunus yedoensis var. nudiflora TaxID=2094558 RepID=A0A314ZSE0_PRUYE|nr:L-aminoadipate-semialdehyde dehydrogenase-phosphopantetheinyl transferase isoform X2 [Prunus yedoensis var. nudiflora]